jgi:hypothetical protein
MYQAGPVTNDNALTEEISAQVNEDVLTGKANTYPAAAAWLTENVKGNNLQNMLVGTYSVSMWYRMRAL